MLIFYVFDEGDIKVMAYEGSVVSQSERIGAAEFKVGRPDVDEAAKIAMETLGLLKVTLGGGIDLRRCFSDLAELGFDGRLIVGAPEEVSTLDLIAAVESRRPDGVKPADVKVYTESTPQGERVLDEESIKGLAQIALFRNNPGDIDPILHFPNLYFKAEGAEAQIDRNETQLGRLEEANKAFQAEYDGLKLRMPNARDFLFMALMDLIRGVDPKEGFILNQGIMISDPVEGELPEISYSSRGGINIHDSYGNPNNFTGVGVSAVRSL